MHDVEVAQGVAVGRDDHAGTAPLPGRIEDRQHAAAGLGHDGDPLRFGLQDLGRRLGRRACAVTKRRIANCKLQIANCKLRAGIVPRRSFAICLIRFSVRFSDSPSVSDFRSLDSQSYLQFAICNFQLSFCNSSSNHLISLKFPRSR